MVTGSAPIQKCPADLCRRSNEYFCVKNLLRFGLILSAFFVAAINEVDAIECGTVNLYRQAILGGKGVIKDEWPFIAALYYTKLSKFFCGGTIISQKHVLTAAHCVQKKGKSVPLSPDEITVRLGAYNLTDRSESDAIDRIVSAIHIHPDWKFNEERYDGDIAILALNENISYSNHVRPVCMPPSRYLIDGLVGTVVGWGMTENKTAEGIPKKIEIDALSDTDCYETDKEIGRYASERSFCGEGSGAPSNGDSGGGFFAVAGSGWVQFGTVSFVRPKTAGNVLTIGVYMKLTSLRDWIAGVVEQTGGTISMATTKSDLNCTYMYNDDPLYVCRLFDLNIRQENFVVQNFTGSHVSRHSNDNVEQIIFETGVVASLPRNFGNIFKNLKSLVISPTARRFFTRQFEKLDPSKRIQFAELDGKSLSDLPNLQLFEVTQTDLKSLDVATFSTNYKLTTVQVSWNGLKSLPRNLFRNNLLLESVSFDYNSIEFIDENIFEMNTNLSAVSLKRNRLRHLSKHLFQHNTELQSIDLSNNLIRSIAEQTFATNPKLRSVNLSSNKLQSLPKNLLRGLAFLKSFHVNGNLLNAIDEQFFGTNVEIEEIDLSSNQLVHIPASLFRNNSQLTIVLLAGNAIETIDGNLFENNFLLQKIDLESNLLVSLPGNVFRHNIMIDTLIVDGNLLETVHERTFEMNARLIDLSFKDNLVTFLPERLFRNNSILRFVRFDKNFLVTLDESLFQTNSVLYKVTLSSNLLNHLPENLFRNNPLLHVVDLSQNLLTTLNENLFRYNPKLFRISLREGSLQSLPRNLFRGNQRLQYIDLMGNHLQFIETNFTALKSIGLINLNRNPCINAVFYDKMRNTFRISETARRIDSLTEFQDHVTTNCS